MSSYLLDAAYRRHCYLHREHTHGTEAGAQRCINDHQPGSPFARAHGCTCRPGHIFGGCSLHSPLRAAFKRQRVEDAPPPS